MIQRLQAILGDRYRVERELGSGGMAIVYLAQDLKHGRPVAIKVLRPELAAAIGPERFIRETEIAARLQHPHIVPVYDSGAADGVFYYVMPFVEGESLRELLDREKQLSPTRAREIAREVAAALQYAHERDLVHRDIKPENIMISGGQAVVTDFGIARAISAAAEGRLTGTGFAIGTPTYMSPEQALGDEQIDGRSDIYSLGCVLYEMLAGQPPFSGPSLQAILLQSLSGPRPQLRATRKDTPPGIDAVVTRALAKEPAERFASAAEFAAALSPDATAPGRPPGAGAIAIGAAVLALAVLTTWWLARPTRAVVSGAETIAVMPFTTSGPGVEFLREGMMDLLSKNLDEVGGIHAVDPRTVLLRWKKSAGTGDLDRPGALAVGRAAGAATVVLGSVVAAGSSVRLSADLASLDGTVLARASADGPTDNVLNLVDSLSLRLLREIWRSKQPLPSVHLSAITTGSVDAVRAYLAGERYYRRSQWDSAITAFRRALEIDSSFALASFRLSLAQGWAVGITAESRAAAEAAFRHANHLPARDQSLVMAHRLFEQQQSSARDTMLAFVQRYPDDAEGWHLLGDIQFHGAPVYGLDLPALYAPFNRSLELDPSFTPTYEHLVDLSLMYGDSAKFFRSLDMLDSVGRANETDLYRAAGHARWQSPDSVESVMTRSLRERPSVWGGLAASLVRSPDVPAQRLVGLVDAVGARVPAGPAQAGFLAQKADLFFALGRLSDGKKAAGTLMAANAQMAAGVALSPVLIGIAPPAYLDSIRREYAKVLTDPATRDLPTSRYFQVILALARNDRAGARELLRAARAARADTVTRPVLLGPAFEGLDGWLATLDGDTASGVRKMRHALEGMGYGGTAVSFAGPLRLELATTLAARAETRDEGIARLNYGLSFDPMYIAPARYVAAQALEAKGDRQGAALAYADFARLWKNADPDLQPKVEAARAAMARLASEPVR